MTFVKNIQNNLEQSCRYDAALTRHLARRPSDHRLLVRPYLSCPTFKSGTVWAIPRTQVAMPMIAGNYRRRVTTKPGRVVLFQHLPSQKIAAGQLMASDRRSGSDRRSLHLTLTLSLTLTSRPCNDYPCYGALEIVGAITIFHDLNLKKFFLQFLAQFQVADLNL